MRQLRRANQGEVRQADPRCYQSESFARDILNTSQRDDRK